LDKKKKAIAFTAFAVFISLLIVISLFFVINMSVSPPGKTIVKKFVYPDGTSIGAGLTVALDGVTATTGADGSVTFGGLVDRTYTITWSWQGIAYSETVTIDCTKIIWEFTNEVPYWEICKTFTYPDGTPIEGLYVTMDGWSGYTDPSGTVSFSGVKAGTYTISWSWQGIADSEDVTITFDTPSPVKKTNVLPFWTVCKTFVYDLEHLGYPPVVGLTVTFDGRTGVTDETGTVCFENVVAGTYTLGWMWCEQSASEEVIITFDTPSPVVVPENKLPAKFIKVRVFCEETGSQVPAGLKVSVSDLAGTFTDIKYTGANGTGWFGSGYPDGTYIIKFYWCGERTYEVIIDCTKQYWVFDYYVPNPTITKTFLYDIDGYPPVVGLEVSLYRGEELVVSLETDDTGTVVFDGQYVAVCEDYYLKYSWGSTECTEGPIHFAYADGELRVCLWEKTNYLEPKGGGDEKLRLAEWVE